MYLREVHWDSGLYSDGPDAVGDEPVAVEYNVNSGEPLSLDGTMASYPKLTYEWFAGESLEATGAEFVVGNRYYVSDSFRIMYCFKNKLYGQCIVNLCYRNLQMIFFCIEKMLSDIALMYFIDKCTRNTYERSKYLLSIFSGNVKSYTSQCLSTINHNVA